MADGFKVFAAALTGLALLRSLGVEARSVVPSMGPLRPLDPEEEKTFEILWEDAEKRTVLEGPKRVRVLPMRAEEAARALAPGWIRVLVDEPSMQIGTGTGELWVKKAAVSRKVPSSVWAFRAGQPVRTSTLLFLSGRRIEGVLS